MIVNSKYKLDWIKECLEKAFGCVCEGIPREDELVRLSGQRRDDPPSM